MKKDIYQEVTNQIIEIIEAGTLGNGITWDKSSSGLPRNFGTKQTYSGVNILLLWHSTITHGFNSNKWLTYKQAQALGGQVKKGSKGTACVYFNVMEKENKFNPEEIDRIPFLKEFTVFNLNQIEGIEEEILQDKGFNHEASESLLKATGAHIIEMGVKAFYTPSKDSIFLPNRNFFNDEKDFYSVAFHELTHWTGAKDRLNRDFKGRFGDESYAFEELIAELGAAFLCADMGFTFKTLPDHADYLNSWLSVLKNDKRAIITASSQASKAHAFIKDLATNIHNSQEKRAA